MKPTSLKRKLYSYIFLILLSFMVLVSLLYLGIEKSMRLDSLLMRPIIEMKQTDILRGLMQEYYFLLNNDDHESRKKLLNQLSIIISHTKVEFGNAPGKQNRLNLLKEKWERIKTLDELYTLSNKKDLIRNKIFQEAKNISKFMGVYHDRKIAAVERVSESNRRSMLRMTWIMLTVLFLVSMMTVALAWNMGKSTIVAIKKLANAMHLFSNGKMDFRISEELPTELQGLCSGFNQMAERIEQNYNELHNISIQDELTGALNYRQFNRDLHAELERSSRYKHSFVLLIMDVNSFKAINDTYGHQAGNEILKSIVHTIRDNMRVTDNLYRIGGDEFAVLLPETDYQGGEIVMQRMYDAVLNKCFSCFQLVTIRTSVSIGKAVYPQDGRSADEIILKADSEMYRIKREFNAKAAQLPSMSSV